MYIVDKLYVCLYTHTHTHTHIHTHTHTHTLVCDTHTYVWDQFANIYDVITSKFVFLKNPMYSD